MQLTYFQRDCCLTLVAANSVTDGNALCKRCSADIDFSNTQVRTFTNGYIFIFDVTLMHDL